LRGYFPKKQKTHNIKQNTQKKDLRKRDRQDVLRSSLEKKKCLTKKKDTKTMGDWTFGGFFFPRNVTSVRVGSQEKKKGSPHGKNATKEMKRI